MTGTEPDVLSPATHQRVADLLDRLTALLDDFERDLDNRTRRSLSWSRISALHDMLDELLRDEDAIDAVDGLPGPNPASAPGGGGAGGGPAGGP